MSCITDLLSTWTIQKSPTRLLKPIVFLLISNLSNGLRLHQFLGTKTTEANKSLKTDANGAH